MRITRGHQLLLVALLFSGSVMSQDTLINSLESLRVHNTGIKKYVDKKAFKEYINSLGEKYWFYIVFKNVTFNKNTGIIQIEGYALSSESVADTARKGLCCIEILATQVKRRCLLKKVRHLGRTNNSTTNPSETNGHFFIKFQLDEKDTLIYYFPDQIVEFTVGRLLKT
jgi:hypothetical protein